MTHPDLQRVARIRVFLHRTAQALHRQRQLFLGSHPEPAEPA